MAYFLWKQAYHIILEGPYTLVKVHRLQQNYSRKAHHKRVAFSLTISFSSLTKSSWKIAKTGMDCVKTFDFAILLVKGSYKERKPIDMDCSSSMITVQNHSTIRQQIATVLRDSD